MQDKARKISAMRGLRETSTTNQSEFNVLFTVNPQQTTKDVARVSFLISKDHDMKLKMFCAQYGKKLKRLVEDSLQQFFESGAKQTLFNPYANDGSGTVQRGVNIPVELKTQLDAYVKQEDVSMRFVVEALLAQYTKNKE